LFFFVSTLKSAGIEINTKKERKKVEYVSTCFLSSGKHYQKGGKEEKSGPGRKKKI